MAPRLLPLGSSSRTASSHSVVACICGRRHISTWAILDFPGHGIKASMSHSLFTCSCNLASSQPDSSRLCQSPATAPLLHCSCDCPPRWSGGAAPVRGSFTSTLPLLASTELSWTNWYSFGTRNVCSMPRSPDDAQPAPPADAFGAGPSPPVSGCSFRGRLSVLTCYVCCRHLASVCCCEHCGL